MTIIVTYWEQKEKLGKYIGGISRFFFPAFGTGKQKRIFPAWIG
ncbi:MAG TPA: hypothetical protein VKA38_11555 [Draconibacterium sp.]|nr:hypothetical protein [Draconibacterium sp.]